MFDTFTQKFPRDYTAAYTISPIIYARMLILQILADLVICEFNDEKENMSNTPSASR